MIGRSVLALAILAAAVHAAASEAFAAFDLIPLRPAERGSATALALGLADAGAGTAAKPDASACVFGFKPHGISEIDFAAASVEIPIASRLKTLTFSYSRLGALGYREEVYGASAGFGAAGTIVSPGIRVCVAQTDDRLSDWAVFLDICADSRLSPGVRTRAYIDNALGSGLIRHGGRCPTRMGAGLGIAAAPNLTVGIEIGKTAGFPTVVSSGAEFSPVGILKIRSGLKTYPKEFTFGAGVRIGRIELDLGSSVNLALGITHEAGATFFW